MPSPVPAYLFAAYEDGGQPAWLGSSEPLGRYWWPPEIHQTGGMTVSDVMQAFARVWNTDDDAGRLRLLTTACVPGVVLVAPQGTLTGIGALSASIREFRQACPAAAVTFGPPDKHGGFLRVAWVTRWDTGQPDLAGEDFGELDAGGRVRLLVYFDGLRRKLPDQGTRCRRLRCGRLATTPT